MFTAPMVREKLAEKTLVEQVDDAKRRLAMLLMEEAKDAIRKNPDRSVKLNADVMQAVMTGIVIQDYIRAIAVSLAKVIGRYPNLADQCGNAGDAITGGILTSLKECGMIDEEGVTEWLREQK